MYMGKTITVFHSGIRSDVFLKGIIEAIKKQQENLENTLNILDLSTLSISPCQGCFHCWTKTPGLCILKDDGHTVASSYINSDIVIFVSRICFGGYDGVIKCAIDRLIPLILPFFRKYQGETHHKKRYKTYPSLFPIGVIDHQNEEMEQIFQALLQRNILNFCPPTAHLAIIREDDQGHKTVLLDHLNRIEEV